MEDASMITQTNTSIIKYNQSLFLKKNLLILLMPITLCFAGLIVNGMSVLSPAYFSLIFAFILLFIIPRLKTHHLYSTAYIIIISSYLFFQFIINPTGDKKTGLFLIISINSYWVFELFFNHFSIDQLLKICQKYLKFNLILYAIELIIRLKIAHFNIRYLISPDFYLWRFYTLKEINVIGGADTNFIATHLLSLYFICLYLRIRYRLKLRKYNYLFAIFIFFTFCRSSWISTLLGHITIIAITKKDKSISITRFILILIFIIGILCFIVIYNTDASFLTKIDIFQKTLGFIQHSSMQDLIFGLGYLNSIQIIGKNVAHNLISTLLIDTGIVGLFGVLNVWIISLWQSRFYTIYLIFPIFIFALSFIQNFIPYFYALLALILVLEEKSVK